jgi:long-chain fatty acid transport protein
VASWGLGFNLGLLFKPLDYLSAGVSYRSQVRQQVNGKVRFRPLNTFDGDASGSIILPDMVFAGIMVQPLKQLSVEGGIIWTHGICLNGWTSNLAMLSGRYPNRKNDIIPGGAKWARNKRPSRGWT